MVAADKSEQYALMQAARKEVSLLFEAAKEGDVETMKKCLEASMKGQKEVLTRAEMLSGFRDGNGRHVLHFAGVSGKVEAVRWVLSEAPELLNVLDENGISPLTLACSRGGPNLRSVTALLEAGADVKITEKKTGATALHRATASKLGVEIMKRLVEYGSDVDAAAKNSGTPLHWAAGDDELSTQVRNSGSVTRTLIGLGATIDAIDGRGLTPLVLASATHNTGAVVALAEHNADCGFVVSGGATVAHMCTDTGDATALKAIVLSGKNGLAAANRVDDNGFTALDVARHKGFEACAKILNDAGVHAEIGATHRSEEISSEEEKKAETSFSGGGETKKVPEGKKSSLAAPRLVKDAKAALRRKDAGNAALARGDLEAAIADYSEAIALDATQKVFYSNRAAARLALFEKLQDEAILEAALCDADTCVDIDATWQKSHFRRGSVLVALKRYEDAANAFWEALRLDANNAQLKKALKDCVDRGRLEHHSQRQEEDD